MIDISVAGDNFRHDDKPVQYYLEWSSQNGCNTVEMNTVNGEDFFEGLGFSPAISLNSDMISLRKLLDRYKLEVSQLDCHYALHTWQSIPYMIQGIKAASILNCPYIATTDGADVPDGMTLDEVYNRAAYHIGEALRFAKSNGVGINIEPHGPLTTDLKLMVKIMKHFDDPLVGINFDIGNTFIAGKDPFEMTRELLPWIRHFHVKDVAPDLQENIGEDTGIASSQVYVGQGLNADNIKAIVALLQEKGWSGTMSLECRGEENSLKSLEWFRGIVGQ